jgi:hypothetical protein
MKKISLLFFPISLINLCAGTFLVINSSVYDWDKLAVKKTPTGEERVILSGPARTLDMFDVKAITLSQNQSVKEFRVETGFDELLIVKEGVYFC